jgi:hypothetical protein
MVRRPRPRVARPRPLPRQRLLCRTRVVGAAAVTSGGWCCCTGHVSGPRRQQGAGRGPRWDSRISAREIRARLSLSRGLWPVGRCFAEQKRGGGTPGPTARGDWTDSQDRVGGTQRSISTSMDGDSGQLNQVVCKQATIDLHSPGKTSGLSKVMSPVLV